MHYFKTETLDVLSSLIGLSRALENDPAPDGDILSLLFAAVVMVAEDTVAPELKGKLIEAKKKEVPSCFVCQSPCGHNDDYPQEKLSLLDNATTKEILTLLEKIIKGDRVAEEKKLGLTLRGLIYISSDYGNEYIDSLIETLRNSVD